MFDIIVSIRAFFILPCVVSAMFVSCLVGGSIFGWLLWFFNWQIVGSHFGLKLVNNLGNNSVC